MMSKIGISLGLILPDSKSDLLITLHLKDAFTVCKKKKGTEAEKISKSYLDFV